MKEFEITINNKKVFDFYKNNPSLSFEQINLLCVDLFENILQDANTAINKSISNQILTECLENKNKLHELSNSINSNFSITNNNINKLSSDIIIKLHEIKKEYIEDIKTIINNNFSNDKFKDILEKSSLSITNEFNHKLDKNNDIIVNNLSNKIEKINEINKDTLLNNLSNKIETKLDKINDFNKDTINTLLIKFNSDTTDKINTLIQQSNNTIIDKTNILLKDIIPENNKILNDCIKTFFNETKNIIINNNNNQLINDFISKFNLNLKEKETYHDILNDLNSYLKQNKNELIDKFINTFDDKYNSLLNNIQQPLIHIISCNDDKINKNINRQQETTEKMLFNLDDFLNKHKHNSSIKGKYSEAYLKQVLEQMFKSGNIIDCSKESHSGDIIMHRDGYDSILIENKSHDGNVPSSDVNKFIYDCEQKNMSGILLSQFTGITSKKNFHIDIIKNNKILVYLHDVDYSPTKIQTAIDIIDNLYLKLKNADIDDDANNIIIPPDILEDINKEYIKIITHKETIINIIKESNKKILDEVKNIYIPSLDNFLSSKIKSTKITYTCEVCKIFVAQSTSSLAAHKKGKNCKAYNIVNNISNNSNEEPALLITVDPENKTKTVKSKNKNK